MKRNYFLITVLFLGVALLLTGCFESAKYTGGGSLDSVECGEKANFGFVFNACKDEAKGVFNYHDMADGVKMKGELKEIKGENEVTVYYRSTNPRERGDGVAKLEFYDMGEGNENHGWFKIKVYTGPFAGYRNEGIIQGNIQYHECNDE